jgi:hypothetical protein
LLFFPKSLVFQFFGIELNVQIIDSLFLEEHFILHVILFVLDQGYLIEKLINYTILGLKHIA